MAGTKDKAARGAEAGGQIWNYRKGNRRAKGEPYFPPGALRVLGHQTLGQRSEEGATTESCAGLDTGEPLAGCGLHRLSQGRHIPRLDSPSWDRSQRCPCGSSEVCSLTRTLIILRHSPGAGMEMKGDCRKGGLVAPVAGSRAHSSRQPARVSGSSAGVNYMLLLSSSWGHGGHSPG